MYLSDLMTKMTQKSRLLVIEDGVGVAVAEIPNLHALSVKVIK